MKQKVLVATDPNLLAIAEREIKHDYENRSERLKAIEHVRKTKTIYQPLVAKYKR